MDSLKEKDKPATKPPKRPRIEVDEEMVAVWLPDWPLWIRKSLSRYKPHEIKHGILNGLTQ